MAAVRSLVAAMGDEILTIQDVASRLKLAERTVYAMATEREMPAFKIRGQWRIRQSDFELWLDEIARGGPAPVGMVSASAALPPGGDHPAPETDRAAGA